MDRGEAGAAAGTCCPVTSDIHTALGIIPAARREAVEPALVNRRGLCRDLSRARAIRNRHRACDLANEMPHNDANFGIGTLALLWQIYSRYFSSLIQDRQYGHR